MKLPRPIRFDCRARFAITGREIAAGIADLSQWPNFKGYGMLPGIASAVYDRRTETMVGSRIRATNTDGSGHVEEILAWDPDRRILMKLHEFTPPLRGIADHFTEEWIFSEDSGSTGVIRRFELFPKSALTRPALWVISRMFRRAIQAHLEQLGGLLEG